MDYDALNAVCLGGPGDGTVVTTVAPSGELLSVELDGQVWQPDRGLLHRLQDEIANRG